MAVDYQDIRRRCQMTVGPMKNEFDSIKGRLREIAENVLPQAKRGLDDEVENYTHRAHSESDDHIVCTVPLEALRKGAAGFLVNLMNPARKWYHLDINEDARMLIGNDDKAKLIVEKIQDKVDEVMHTGGAYIEYRRMFEHLLAFGFACGIVHSDDKFIAKIDCLRVGTYALGADNDGRINRLYRRIAMTPEEIVRKFGGGMKGREKIPERIIQAWKRGDVSDTANVVVCNLIEPNEETYKVGSDDKIGYGIAKKFAYRSVYWLDGTSDGETSGILKIEGYKYNPIIAPRMTVEMGDIYGRGRGHDALNACRAIQGLRMDELEISSNRAEPPLIASNDLREEGLNLGRGQVTYANIGEQRSEMVLPVLPNPPTSDETRQTLIELQQEIKAMFFNDEFATIDSLKLVNDKQKRTAAEINALTSENMLLLAGIILMLDHELLDPVVKVFTSYVIDKVKSIMGIEIPDQAIAIKYVSNLHVAQLTQEINSVDSSVARAAQLASLGSPKTARVLDHFNFDMIVRKLHGLVGASEEFLNPLEAVEQSRMAEDAAAQQAQQAQAEQAQAQLELDRAKAAAQAGRANQSNVNAAQMLGDPAAAMGGYV